MTATGHQFENDREGLAGRKARLQAIRERAREQHINRVPGLQVAALISELTDQLVLDLFQEVLGRFDAEAQRVITANSAIAAVGGSGRGDAAPYSDTDLLFLHRNITDPRFGECVAETVRDCWDAGIKLGHSVRTVGESLAMAIQDPQCATPLVEARLLWGNARLFASLKSQFYRKVVRRRIPAFYHDCVTARESEWDKFGETARQLQPDIKRSPGGLRDVHLIRWIGFACYGTADLDLLRLQGALTREDSHTLLTAYEFLTRIRADLHFAAGKPQEVLSRSEQMRLAEVYGSMEPQSPPDSRRPVEMFMQTYFRHTTAIEEIASRFIAVHQPHSLGSKILKSLLTHRSNGIFKVSPEEIDVISRYRTFVCGHVEQILNLYELAGLYGVVPAPKLIDAIKHSPPFTGLLSDRVARSFMSILNSGASVGRLLRSLYSVGLLEFIIPEMSHVRCLLQFNQYHHFTVDEHSFRAVEAAQALEADTGALGTAYREIRQKEILHLAILLHDLGKGYEEDHSEVGARIADTVGRRLGLSNHVRELLVFLVRKHLLMAHLAFRRDLSDPQVLLKFSRDVGSPEHLRMLYVLTAADMTAVGPGTWTEWKAELLTELYDSVMLLLSGEHQHFGEEDRLRRIYAGVLEALRVQPGDLSVEEIAREPIVARLETFPQHYLAATPVEQIADDLRQIIRMSDPVAIVRGVYEAATNTVEYRVITRDQVGSGCFSKITGALAAKRLSILSAQICTTTEGIVVDGYRVLDADHTGEIPDFRLKEVEQTIYDVLSGRRIVESLFPQRRQYAPLVVPDRLSPEPTRVVIDNESSERFTIVDVFAHDRKGLLYKIAATLLALDLSVSLAKIATSLDQVLDVFYVTDREGAKIQNEQRLQQIEATLVREIEAFERQGIPAQTTSV